MPHVVAEIPESLVKYKDVFSLRNLYIMLHEMLLEEGWWGQTASEVTPGIELHEDLEILYSENVYQKGIHSGGKELWAWWRTRRGGPSGAGHGYFQDILEIDWHSSYLQEREVVHQGKKMSVQWGELELYFRPKIIGDHTGAWAKHPILKHFQYIYETRIMHQDIEKREKALWRDVYRLTSRVKTYLKMRTFIPEPEPFHPELYGWEE